MAKHDEHPPHFQNLLSNLEEVDRLLQIHTQLGQEGPGRRRGVEVLNKSAIVLLVACWEAFVEDLVGGALEAMIESAGDHSVFPKAVLERVASVSGGVEAR